MFYQYIQKILLLCFCLLLTACNSEQIFAFMDVLDQKIDEYYEKEDAKYAQPPEMRVYRSIKDDVETVKKRIENGGDLHYCTGAKFHAQSSALELAIIHSAYDVVELLCEYNVDISFRCEEGLPPLFLARNIKMTDVLLQCGADINVEMQKPFIGNILMAYLSSRETSFLKPLAERGARIETSNPLGPILPFIDGADSSCESYATSRSRDIYAEGIEILLNLGKGKIDLEQIGFSGRSALASAVRNNSYEFAKALLKHGANVNATFENNTYAVISYINDIGSSDAKRTAEEKTKMLKLLQEYNVNMNPDVKVLPILP